MATIITLLFIILIFLLTIIPSLPDCYHSYSRLRFIIIQFADAADGCFDCTMCRCNGAFTSCVPCPPGKSCSGLLADCCLRGEFAQGGNCECDTCGAGTYQDEECQGVCKLCSAGTRNPNTGSTSSSACTSVPAGHFSPPGASAGTPCPAGTFCAGGCAHACRACDANSYQAATTQSSCQGCPAGTDSRGVTGSTSATACLPCGPGSYSPTSRSSCLQCSAGFQCAAAGLSAMTQCDRGSFSSAGAVTCTPCAPNFIAPDRGTKDRCSPCAAGTMTDFPAQSECRECFVNSYNDVPGQPCKKCQPGYWTAGRTGRTSCEKCPPPGCTLTMTLSESPSPIETLTASMGTISATFEQSISFFSPSETASQSSTPDDSQTFSLIETETVSPSTTHELSPSISLSETDETETQSSTKFYTKSTHSLSRSELSDSVSSSDPDSTFSVSASATASPSNPTRTLSDVDPSQTASAAPSISHSEFSPSLSSSQNESTFTTSASPSRATSTLSSSQNEPSLTQSHSFGTRSASYSSTHELTNYSSSHSKQTPSETLETSQSTSSSQTSSITLRVYIPPALGLSAAAQQAIQTSSNVVSGAMALAAAPAALSVQRGLAVLQLIGCPPRNPSDGKKWTESNIPFPASLIPGFGWGESNGWFNRGAIISFFAVVLSVCLVGFLNTETIGSPISVTDPNLGKNDLSQHKSNSSEQEKPLLSDSSSSSASSREPQKVSKVSMMVMAVTSVLIGMWSPQAGLLFSAWTPEDLALSLGPLVAVLVFGLSICIRVHKSLVFDQAEGRGIIFVKSYVLERKGGLGVSHDRYSPKSILQSPVGRYCLLGDYFWSRPRGVIGRDAQILLSSLGSQLQKFRGPVFTVDWVQTENPLAHIDTQQFKKLKEERKRDKEKSLPEKLKRMFSSSRNSLGRVQEKQQKQEDDETNSSSSDENGDEFSPSEKKSTQKVALKEEKKKNRDDDDCDNNNHDKNEQAVEESSSSSCSAHFVDDWEEIQEPTIHQKDFTWASYLSPHYLIISWFFSASVGFLSGVARGMPEQCPALAKSMCFLNIASFLFLLYLRPFVISMRNHISFVLDGVVAISSLLASILLVTNSEDMQKGPLMGFAITLQVSMTFVAMTGGLVLIGGTVIRFFLLRCGDCAVASQEDMWAKQVIRIKEGEEDEFDLCETTEQQTKLQQQQQQQQQNRNDSNNNDDFPPSNDVKKKSKRKCCRKRAARTAFTSSDAVEMSSHPRFANHTTKNLEGESRCDVHKGKNKNNSCKPEFASSTTSMPNDSMQSSSKENNHHQKPASAPLLLPISPASIIGNYCHRQNSEAGDHLLLLTPMSSYQFDPQQSNPSFGGRSGINNNNNVSSHSGLFVASEEKTLTSTVSPLALLMSSTRSSPAMNSQSPTSKKRSEENPKSSLSITTTTATIGLGANDRSASSSRKQKHHAFPTTPVATTQKKNTKKKIQRQRRRQM